MINIAQGIRKEPITNTKDKTLISTFTHLKEIYSDFQSDKEEIEPIYENLRIKFKSDYKSEAEFFCRVPYVITLFGDEVTKLFEDKIVTTIERDLVTCASRNKDKLKLTFQTHNTFTNSIEIDLFDSKQSFEDFPEYFKYFWSGFQTCVRYINAETIFGINFMVNLNIVDYQSFNLLPTMFLSAFLITLYLYGKQDSVNTSVIADICISEISKLGFINPTPIIFAQLFLPKNSLGLFLKGIFNFYTLKVSRNFLLFFCDSLSKEAPIYYSTWNQNNKRSVEIRLGLALLLKRYRKQITSKEICEMSSSIKKFMQYFEYNLDTMFGLVENFLKRSAYKLKDIKDELNLDVKEILSGIPCYETVLSKAKDYSLYPRLMYVLKEIEKIEKIAGMLKQSSVYSEQEEKSMLDKIVNLFRESNKSLKVDYECFNDEIEQIENIREIDKKISEVSNTGNKLISRGWKGSLAFLGESKSIMLIREIVNNFFSKLEENEDINLWISDDTSNILFTSKIGGSACLLNPIYDDFYMFDIYDENINEIHKTFLEKLNTFQKEEKGRSEKNESRDEKDSQTKNLFDIKF